MLEIGDEIAKQTLVPDKDLGRGIITSATGKL